MKSAYLRLGWTLDADGLRTRLASLDHAIELWTARQSFGTSARLRFYERLSGYLVDGIPMVQAVSMIHQRWEKKKKSVRFMSAMLLDNFREGRRLADALLIGKWSPTSEVVLIEAGERSGNLARGLEQAIFVTSSIQTLRSSIIKGLAYPVFLLAALVGLFAFFGIKTVPEMIAVIPLEKWPPETLAFYYVTTGLVKYGAWIGGVLLALMSLSIWSLPRWTGRWRNYFDRIPPWSLYRVIQGASTLIAVGGLLSTGTPLADALRIVQASAPRWLAGHIVEIQVRLRTGLPAGDAMDTHLFDFGEVGDDLADYGRLSNFKEAVVKLGRRTIERILHLVATATAITNTVLIAIIAGSVLWMYVNFMAVSDAASQSFH